ncbi:MAG: hypothetical protein KDD51_14580 [Bdellovibrionales bacterium]|nr:hypothetical protein [Bdellovibrionales bacterium]
MLRLLLCLSVVALAYDSSELPKAYTDNLGAFEAPTEKVDITAGPLEEIPPDPVVPPEPSTLERVMNAEAPEPELQSEVLKSILNEEPSNTKGKDDEWQTHKKFVEQEEKEQRLLERRERRRRNKKR